MTILLLFLTILLVFTITLLVVEKLLFQPFKGTGTKWLHHSDQNGRKVFFKSGRNELSGWFYGEDNDNAKGLIIISHAMGVTSEYYLPEIMYFADRGYKVFAFDNTRYGYNKGLFCGFPQAVKDLKSAIIFADDHTLPIILFGHSMGGYAVSTVLADPEVKSHNISGVIEYSGFNDIKGVVRDFLGADNSLLKKFMAELICLGQFLIFGRMIYNKASDVVNANSDVNFIMVHGIKDEEVRVGSTALISRDFVNTNVRKIIAYNEGVNTHMGVIRNDKGSKPDVNQKILDEIISTLG